MKRKKEVTNNRYLSKIFPFADRHKVLAGGTLPRHLVMVHNVAKGSEEQKKMLRLAKCYVEPPKDCKISSPRKEFSVIRSYV